MNLFKDILLMCYRIVHRWGYFQIKSNKTTFVNLCFQFIFKKSNVCLKFINNNSYLFKYLNLRGKYNVGYR